MDEKEEDKSAESQRNHIKYYKSLVLTAASMQKELDSETDSSVISHLKNRIDALNKDKKRIEQMFPELDWNNVG